VPGTGALRPKAGTRLAGLVLAGAWTDTGWPDTMEGAVRSGLSAAIELRQTVLTADHRSARISSQGTATAAGPFEPNASASTIGVRQ
jgi:uncharacterized protein with NAD-binding domain and iron-sulfur cluster